MALNNTITLTGNLGSEVRILTTEENTFAAVSVATTDSYKDDSGHWQDKETIWHNILAFSPRVIQELKALKSGSRVTITGSLSYRPFEVVNGEGEVITKKEASIIARKVELTPLVKKAQNTSETV